MMLRNRLRAALLAVVAVSLVQLAPVHAQDGPALHEQSPAEELRARAEEKLTRAGELEAQADDLKAEATALAEDAANKRELATRRIATAEKKEAKAQKRPGSADLLLTQAANLRDRAAELNDKADRLEAQAAQRNNTAASLRERAATLRSEAAELNAAADALEESPDEDQLNALWTTTLTVGVLNADRVNERLGFQDAYSYEHGSLTNKTVVNGDDSYTISGLTWSKLRREVWIVARQDSWDGLADYFDDKWLSCTLDGVSVVSGRLEARFIKARESMKLDVQSAPWAEDDTVVCEVLASEPGSPPATTTTTAPPTTTTAPPTTTTAPPTTTTTLPPEGQPSRLWASWMQVGAVWTDDYIGFFYHDVLGYGYLNNPWITLGNTRYQVAALEWLETAEAIRLVAAYPASELLDGSWLRCRLQGNKLILEGELDDNGFGTLWIDGHSSSPWAEDDVVHCEILEHEPPSG